jgi:prephenate dehydrogenase
MWSQRPVPTLSDKLDCFLPAHPIAGKAQAGLDHAEGSLYQDRALILTPLAHNTPAQIAQATALWQAIGSRVHQMTPEAHDQSLCRGQPCAAFAGLCPHERLAAAT